MSAPLELVRISEDEFFDIYRPLPKDGNSAPLYEFDEVKDQDLHHVWTIVEGDDGGWYAQPGFHVVNKVGYTLTEKAWEHEHIEAVYFEGSPEDADDADPEAGGPRP